MSPAGIRVAAQSRRSLWAEDMERKQAVQAGDASVGCAADVLLEVIRLQDEMTSRVVGGRGAANF
jgi:TolB-like protein